MPPRNDDSGSHATTPRAGGNDIGSNENNIFFEKLLIHTTTPLC
ncbi:MULTISPECIES: hypothetical protein [unclassified Rickettsia]